MSDPKPPAVPNWAVTGCALALFLLWLAVLVMLALGIIHPWQVQ